MKRTIIATLFTLATLTMMAGPALAACTTNTIFIGGKMIICTTCCNGGFCNTFCT